MQFSKLNFVLAKMREIDKNQFHSFNVLLTLTFYLLLLHRFAIELIENNQDRLKAVVILKEKLDYNEQMIYHLVLSVTVSIQFNLWMHQIRILF